MPEMYTLINIKEAKQQQQHNTQTMIQTILGPNSCDNIEKGLILNVILPNGGGK